MKSLPWLVIAALVGILILQRACTPAPPPVKPTVTIQYDTVEVKVPIKVEVKVPGPTKIVTVEVPAKVDTAQILADYFAKKYYKDSIKIGSIGYVIIEDTVSENRITNRKSFGNYVCPEITKTVTINNPPELHNKVYGGFQITAPVLGIGPEVTLTTKQDNLYRLGASFTTGGPMLSFGTAWKIRLKRP